MTPPVFLDTDGILAVWDKADQWHESASRAFDGLVRPKRVLVTTPLVFIECGNAAARTPYRARVDALRRSFLQDGRLIEPTDDDFDRAWLAYGRGEAGEAGIVDHVSFVVMRRLGLNEVFSSDAHFRAAGFRTLF
jgi:predicted nucleic acid-binding protein